MSQKGSRKSKRIRTLLETRKESAGKASLEASTRLQLLPFTNVPLELLYEICSYLQPLDLLHLTRTSSSLRSLLLSKAARQLWIHSFDDLKQRGFPDCPPDLSEPQYANLVLSIYCHECSREDDDTTYYLIILGRTRLCFSCARKSYTSLDQGPWPKSFRPPFEILRFVPWTTVPFAPLSLSDPASLCETGESLSRYRKRKYSVTDVLAMTQEYKALGRDKIKKEAWMKPHAERSEMLWGHAMAWAQYEKRWLGERKAADQANIDARVASIRQKLVDAGWEDELTFLETFSQPTAPPARQQFHWKRFQGVAKLAPLTDEAWGRLYSALEPWLQGTREERLFQEKASTVKARVKEHVEPLYRDFILSTSGDDPFPSIAEVCLIPEFCTLLEDATTDVTQSMFDAVTPILSGFVQQWQRDRKEELLKIMRKSNAYSLKSAPTSEMLHYASTAFICDFHASKAHSEPCAIGYPEIMAHPCCMVQAGALHLPRPRPAEDSQQMRVLWKKEEDKRGGISTTPKAPPVAGDFVRTALEDQLVFVLQDISFGEAAFLHTEALLRLCQLPTTSKVEELQKADPYVVTKCGCFPADHLLRWASTTRMNGSKSHHRKHPDPERIFSLPHEEQQAIVGEMRAARHDDWERGSHYYCALCGHLVADPEGVDHFTERHRMPLEVADRSLSKTLTDGGPRRDFRPLPQPERHISKTGAISAAELKSLRWRR